MDSVDVYGVTEKIKEMEIAVIQGKNHLQNMHPKMYCVS